MIEPFDMILLIVFSVVTYVVVDNKLKKDRERFEKELKKINEEVTQIRKAIRRALDEELKDLSRGEEWKNGNDEDGVGYEDEWISKYGEDEDTD